MTTALEALAPTITCPSCGNDGARGEILYLVDVVMRAEVLSLVEGTLKLEGPQRPSVADPHRNPRLECWAMRSTPERKICGHRWPVPDGIRRLEWEVRS